MKRQAFHSPDMDCPAKLVKEELEAANSIMDTEIKSPTLDPIRSPSSRRERKAPAWLSSYITGGAVTVKESPKPAVPKVSALTKKKRSPQQPSTDELQKVKEEDSAEVPPSLRGESTLKLEDSLTDALDAKEQHKTKISPIALVTKETDSLCPNTSDLGDSETECKQANNAVRKNPSLSKQPKKLSTLSSPTSSATLKLMQSKKKALPKIPTKTPSKRKLAANSSNRVHGVDSKEFNSSNVMEVCDTKSVSISDFGQKMKMAPDDEQAGSLAFDKNEKPKMLEIVFCISTSGAMRDYLAVLQDKTREMVWRLQSLIPNLRLGVFAHTQGGIHDDKPGSGSSTIDHNYTRTGGHSGTKWLDLGATFSQICAFVGSLEPEVTVYPDYVQDNLEMALWKMQRCMSWSSCSYRAVVMVGRGRPNRTSFYLQREHWRGWIRSALEIGSKVEIPIVDWELEAKWLSQMGIHVFTIQAVSPSVPLEEEEDEGSVFFRRVAEITNSLHIKITDASKLIDIMVSVCCACHGPDLLQEHRDTLRDENDGVLPQQLKDIFIALQLHSKRRSLSTLPSLVGDLTVLQHHLKNAEANGNISSSGGEEMSGDEEEDKQGLDVKAEVVTVEPIVHPRSKSGRVQKIPAKFQNAISKPSMTKIKTLKAAAENDRVKSGRIVKKGRTNMVINKNVKKAVTKGKMEQGSPRTAVPYETQTHDSEYALERDSQDSFETQANLDLAINVGTEENDQTKDGKGEPAGETKRNVVANLSQKNAWGKAVKPTAKKVPLEKFVGKKVMAKKKDYANKSANDKVAISNEAREKIPPRMAPAQTTPAKTGVPASKTVSKMSSPAHGRFKKPAAKFIAQAAGKSNKVINVKTKANSAVIYKNLCNKSLVSSTRPVGKAGRGRGTAASHSANGGASSVTGKIMRGKKIG